MMSDNLLSQTTATHAVSVGVSPPFVPATVESAHTQRRSAAEPFENPNLQVVGSGFRMVPPHFKLIRRTSM